MLTLADGRTRVDVFLTEPEGWREGDGPLEIPLSAFTEAIDAACQINKPDYRISATASDTVPDQPLCQEGNATTFGASNYEGTVTILLALDQETGRPVPESNTLWAAVGEKGARAWWAEREGPKALSPIAVGDEGLIYEAISDEPQSPTDRAGYIKRVVPLGIQGRRKFIVVEGE